MRISDWSSDVCSSDLAGVLAAVVIARRLGPPGLCIAIDFDARFRAGEGDALKRRGRRAGHQADQHQQGRGSGTEKATNGHERDPHCLVFKRSTLFERGRRKPPVAARRLSGSLRWAADTLVKRIISSRARSEEHNFKLPLL